MTFELKKSVVTEGFVSGSRTPTVEATIEGDFRVSTDFKATLKRTLDLIGDESAHEWRTSITSITSLEDLLVASMWCASIGCDPLIEGALNCSVLPDPVISETRVSVLIPVTNPRLADLVTHTFVTILNVATVLDEPVFLQNVQNLKRQFGAKTGAMSIMNHRLLLKAAYELDLPIYHLSRSHAVIGNGENSRHFQSTLTEKTSALGQGVAQSKSRTAQYLRALSLPVPDQYFPYNASAAIAEFRRIGVPIVLKPDNLDRGQGVHTNLRSEKEISTAFHKVKSLTPRVLLEPQIQGFVHRLTVFEGSVIKAVQRTPAGVLGDGVRTIETLVQERAKNSAFQGQARRHKDFLMTLDTLALEMLSKFGWKRDDIPEEGHFVRLRPSDNVSMGGSNTTLNLSEDIHPENLALATKAAGALQLDIAGIDIFSHDLSVAWYDNDAIIGEVNVAPQIGTGTTPFVFKELLSEAVPNRGYIDLEIVIVANHLHPDGCHSTESTGVGISTQQAVWIDHACYSRKVENSFTAARTLLLLPSVSKATCYLSPEDVLAYGLPSPYCRKINVVTDSEMEKQALKQLLQPHTEDLIFSSPEK